MHSYDERLTVPVTWWLIPAAAAVFVGLIGLPLWDPAIVLGAIVLGVVGSASAINSYGAVRIRVVQGSLIAGRARIPVTALGQAQVLDAKDARAWRSYRADPRAFMVLRAYIPTAIRVEVVDPEDPTPYVYLSTRRPQQLATALEAVKAA